MACLGLALLPLLRAPEAIAQTEPAIERTVLCLAPLIPRPWNAGTTVKAVVRVYDATPGLRPRVKIVQP